MISLFNMERTIEITKCTLADYFNIKKEEFDTGKCRKRNIIEAKRFLIYFMVNELGVKFLYVSDFMPSLKSHATAMHHYYRMIELMEFEDSTKRKYNSFKTLMLSKGMSKLESELHRQIDIRNAINKNIKQLEKMIDEA